MSTLHKIKIDVSALVAAEFIKQGLNIKVSSRGFMFGVEVNQYSVSDEGVVDYGSYKSEGYYISRVTAWMDK